MPIKIPKTRRKKKTVYDPFLNKKITVENEPYESLTSSVDQKIEEHHTSQNRGILSAFGSDLVWFSVSISVLLASVLFYFQVLQPRILNQISLKAQAQTLQVQNTFTSQVNELAKTQSSILNKNLNAFTDICNPTQLYQDQESDQFQIEQVVKKLQPDETNQTLDNYNIFNQSDIKNEFENYYSFYQKELQNLQAEEQKLEEFIQYKIYKNSWIENCIDIQESINLTTTIEEICAQENILPDTFTQLNDLYSDLRSIGESEQTLCGDWNNTQLFIPNDDGLFVDNSAFRIQWTELFSQITILDQQIISSFDTEQLNQKIAILESQANQTIDNIIEFTQSKNGLTNIWYILDVDTNELSR